MAKIGNGYGSEWHLLVFLGRHRTLLDREVATVTGASAVRWCDFPFDQPDSRQEGEWKGLDFLAESTDLQAAWREAWPSSGNVQNWDAVGQVQVDGLWEWLLVEAKANLEEIRSSCNAREHGGRPRIARTMERTKQALGVAPDRDWLTGYYQYCNRIAALNFLRSHGVAARLLFIYFTGDQRDRGPTCPRDRTGWMGALRAQAEHVGLPAGHPLSDRIHELFLQVVKPAAGSGKRSPRHGP
ncbi:hypothetical protein [Elioraea sp.]|uniref:hypothetical protein n=1 Tax=Elioraea sp. TaxID=2185103 RepID=UPI003F702B87